MNALHKAAVAGDVQRVQALLAAGTFDIDAAADDGWTALLYAIAGVHPAVVALLVDAGADIEAINNPGLMRPLQLAAYLEHTAVMKFLIAAGADVNALTSNGCTALDCAVMEGKVEAVAVLLAAGALINPPSNASSTRPLQLAINFGHTAVMKFLIAAGADVNALTSNGCTALDCAVMEGKIEAVATLLAAGALIDKPSGSAASISTMYLAIHYGSADIVDMLIAAGAGASVRAAPKLGTECLMRASQQGNARMVASLLQAGADCNKLDGDGRSALHYAAESGSVDSARVLIEAGAEWSAPQNEAMSHQAGRTLAAAGYRNWAKIPSPCPTIERSLFAVWQHNADDLAQVVARMEEGVRLRLRAALRGLHRCMPGLEQKLLMRILGEGMSGE